MKRTIDTVLLQWKNSSSHLPLIIRGARQVGKTYAVLSFGKQAFESTAMINLERERDCQKCFDSLDPRRIIQELEIRLNTPIVPGKTLLFLDEIQECPQAITALRYFKEEMPELHVIAAGSLLEFVLNDEEFSFPVGRVQFLFMRPMSFFEFLEANNRNLLKSYLEQTTLQEPPSEQIHKEALKQVRLYLTVGGMPAVVEKYIETESILECRQLENALLQAYEQDFGKYAKSTQHQYLQRLFEKSPQFVGSHVRFSKIDPESSNPAREYKQAIKLLSNAGLIHPIHATSANGLPLRAEASEKKFKLLFLDVGLLQSAMQMDPLLLLNEEFSTINKGPIAEQFVGQELLAYDDPHRDVKLYFWERQQTGSEAEVDYLFQANSHIIPIEVKAGTHGRLRSLQQFMTEKKSTLGIKISEDSLGFSNNILSVPFYLISQLSRLIYCLKK